MNNFKQSKYFSQKNTFIHHEYIFTSKIYFYIINIFLDHKYFDIIYIIYFSP